MRIGIDLTSIWRPTTGIELVAIETTRSLLQIDTHNEYVLFFAKTIHPAFRACSGRFEAVLAPWSHEALLKNVWFPHSPATATLDYLHFPAFPPPWHPPCVAGWTVADATPWLHPETMNFKSRWYHRILGGHAVRNSRILITYSNASRDDLIAWFGVHHQQIHVIYPGLRPMFRRCNDSVAFERIRQFYCLPKDFILFVGTIEPRKNLHRVLSALHMLKADRHFEPALVIVGRKGWLYDPLFNQVRSEGLERCVHLTGYVPDEDLLLMYNMARLLISPSIYEGFGLPSVEAMACGCPVVSSNRGAQHEVTAGCAVHVDPEDVTSIAEGIWRVHNDEKLRTQLRANGLRRAAAFSWDSYAKRFLQIVGHVVEDGCVSGISQQYANCLRDEFPQT